MGDVLITAAPARARVRRTAGAARRTPRRWMFLLVAGWLVQAAVRAWFSRMQVVPLADPDEAAYLEAARLLAGGTASNFSHGTLYQGGYPLLLTPVYWFTSNSVIVYHAVMVINALVGATLMPLAYVACRRLGLGRRTAYALSAVTAVLPAGLFYTEFALSDAIFPVVVLAWLLCVHSLLTVTGRRQRYLAAVSSGLLAGYAYAVHPRGVVIAVGYAGVLILLAVRRLAPRATVAAAGLTLLVTLGAAELMDRYISAAMYPEGARSLSGQAVSRLTDFRGEIQVAEMAGGQLWRLTTDTWGIGTIGLAATVAVIARRGIRRDVRIMAVLAVFVTLAIAYIAPAALPADQPATWASGRYLDGMSVAFFLVGAVVLLRARPARILRYAGAATVLTVITAAIVARYAGSMLPTGEFGAFTFGEPSVLAQGWTDNTSVVIATAVALGLLAFWIGLVLAARRLFPRPGWRALMLVPVLAMNLFAVTQMTTHIAQANTPIARASSLGFVTETGLQPGDKVDVDNGLAVDWPAWIPQSYEVWWTPLVFFDAATTPPAGATVVEVAWPSGKSAQASWPNAPAGWHVVASDQTYAWVAWHRPGS
ncbi:MAG TPA: hypothetical protein VGN41_05360 [Streptosporangiaceae bacterium]